MTNGDNEYDPSFLSVLAGQEGAEVVYAYVTPTPSECHYSADSPSPAPCPSCAMSPPFLSPACPKDTRWLAVTNGDNEYDPSFLSVLVEQEGAEVVAFDYYSRFQRPTGENTVV